MRKLLKIGLVAGDSLAALVLGLVAWFQVASNRRERQANRDEVVETARCDRTRYVVEQPKVQLVGFAPADTQELHFYRLAGHRVVQDTLLHRPREANDDVYCLVAIPFVRFAKSDTIVVATRNKRYFKLTGYHHYADLHYGMVGYLGSFDCRLALNCLVNGQLSEYAQLRAEQRLHHCVLPR